MLQVGNEKFPPIGVLGLAVGYRCSNNTVLRRAIFAGWLVAAKFAGKSLGAGASNK
jgi:hypothetical protein